MATYKSFKQLNKKTLKEDDVVHFKVGNEEYIYKISDNHLMAKNHTMNNEILVILMIMKL
jgi:hypothetical protein